MERFYATCTAIQLLGAPIKLMEILIRGYKKKCKPCKCLIYTLYCGETGSKRFILRHRQTYPISI